MNSEGSDSHSISQLEAWMPKEQSYPAGLYIVATPIGNLADITLRALWVLQLADIVLCEDTRVSRKLLGAYGISAKLIAYHEHNAAQVEPTVIEHLQAGKRVALVSDAGTPLISDPGYRLVRAAARAGHYITSLPGASSVPVALTLSGLPTDQFFFAGFLPSKAQARQRTVTELAQLPCTIVALEAPHRLAESLKTLQAILGDGREIAVARELSKRHEEVLRASAKELAEHYAAKGAPKGEIVLVIAPPPDKKSEGISDDELDAKLRKALSEMRVKDASTKVAEETGLPRKTIYARALQLKENADD